MPVGVEHICTKADCGKDQSHFASGHHAEADDESINVASTYREPGGNLGYCGNGGEGRNKPENMRFRQRANVGVDADVDEEHRNEYRCNRGYITTDALVGRCAREGRSYDECSNDRGKIRRIGKSCKGKGEPNRDDRRDGRASRAIDRQAQESWNRGETDDCRNCDE